MYMASSRPQGFHDIFCGFHDPVGNPQVISELDAMTRLYLEYGMSRTNGSKKQSLSLNPKSEGRGPRLQDADILQMET
jgi:hypothetical protein